MEAWISGKLNLLIALIVGISAVSAAAAVAISSQKITWSGLNSRLRREGFQGVAFAIIGVILTVGAVGLTAAARTYFGS